MRHSAIYYTGKLGIGPMASGSARHTERLPKAKTSLHVRLDVVDAYTFLSDHLKKPTTFDTSSELHRLYSVVEVAGPS